MAVVGVPDPTWGQRLVAAVMPLPSAGRNALAGQVITHCATQLADYKKPRAMVLLEALPRNALGKAGELPRT